MNASMPRRLAYALAFFALFIGSAAEGQDEKKKKRTGRGGAAKRQITNRLKGIELSDEQKEKVAAITKKYAGKMAELQKSSIGLLTAEQRKARNEALREARKNGKKFAEATTAANKAAGLSEEIIGKLNESQKKIRSLTGEMNGEVDAILTDKQKAAIKKTRGKRKKNDKANSDTKPAGNTVSLKLPNMT